MSRRCLDAATQAAAESGVDTLDLHSAAMHDTNVAATTDALLPFAPSEDGVSHPPNTGQTGRTARL